MDADTSFSFRRVATSGCEIAAPDGVVIAWTVDAVWVAMLVDLLNRDAPGDIVGTGGCDNGGNAEDDEENARRAIEWLSDHEPVVTVTFPTGDPPSVRVKDLVEPYLRRAEPEVAELLARYTMKSLADDFLGPGRIDIPGEADLTSRHAPTAYDGGESAQERTAAKKGARHGSAGPPGPGEDRWSST